MEPAAHKKGFTLLEVMLYVVISASMLFAVVSLYQLVIEHQAAFYAETRVGASGTNALRVISDAVRRAESVVEPNPQVITDTLILAMEDPTRNPTMFQLSNGAIVMQEGAEEPISVTSSDVEVYALQFENVTTTDVSSSIHIEIGAEYGLNSGRETSDVSRTFYGTATTR